MSGDNFVTANDTKLFHCKAISSQNHHGRHSSIFSQQKSGYARLRRDTFKVTYVLELYQANKLTENVNLNKPVDTYPVREVFSSFKMTRLFIF